MQQCMCAHRVQSRIARGARLEARQTSSIRQPFLHRHRKQRQHSCGAAHSDELQTPEPTQLLGGKTIECKLRKPLGIIFAQKGKGNPVFVEELVKGGNAEKSGVVQVGDILTHCSAIVLKAGKEGSFESEGYGQRPYENWEKIMFPCEGEDFQTVMGAIGSNNERWGYFHVTIRLRRPPNGTAAPSAA